MREILFKAKRIEDDEWIEGYYQKRHNFLGNEEHLIFHVDGRTVWEYTEIVPETLCQFTGLCDKNGKKIWENDIVLITENVYSTVKFGLYHEAGKSERTHQGFYLESMDKYYYREELGYWAKESVVVGNIFDNKELLQEGSDE